MDERKATSTYYGNLCGRSTFTSWRISADRMILMKMCFSYLAWNQSYVCMYYVMVSILYTGRKVIRKHGTHAMFLKGLVSTVCDSNFVILLPKSHSIPYQPNTPPVVPLWTLPGCSWRHVQPFLIDFLRTLSFEDPFFCTFFKIQYEGTLTTKTLTC